MADPTMDEVWVEVTYTSTVTHIGKVTIPLDVPVDLSDLEAVREAAMRAARRKQPEMASNEELLKMEDLPKVTFELGIFYLDNGEGAPDTDRPLNWNEAGSWGEH